MSGGFGVFRPVVVQRAGWYFRPIRTTLSRGVVQQNAGRRSVGTTIYSSPNASSSPPSRGSGSYDGDFTA
jgi:hypothetical protein